MNSTRNNRTSRWAKFKRSDFFVNILVALTGIVIIAIALGTWYFTGTATDFSSHKDSFTIDTDAGEAVCVVYVAESASIACVWPDLIGLGQ